LGGFKMKGGKDKANFDTKETLKNNKQAFFILDNSRCVNLDDAVK